MADLRTNALAWFADHWERPVCGTSDLARFASVSPNTIKTRTVRGQALVTKVERPDLRDVVAYTGFQVVYNLVHNTCIRRGYLFDGINSGACPEILKICAKVKEETLTPPFNADLVYRFIERGEGNFITHAFEEGDVIPWTGEEATIIPIGTMILRMAMDLYVRNSPDALRSLAE